MSQSGRGVSSTDQGQGAVVGRVFKCNLCVFERIESVGDPIVDVAIDVGRSNESMDHFVHHTIFIYP